MRRSAFGNAAKGGGLAASILSLTAPFAAAEGEVNYIDPQPNLDLRSQNVDPNEDLIKLLRSMAVKPARFMVSPGEISIEGNSGEVVGGRIRVVNEGGKKAKILSASIMGDVPGLSLNGGCEREYAKGEGCDIVLTVAAERPANINTVLVLRTDAPGQEIMSIPVSVKILEPEKEVVPEPPRQPVVKEEPVDLRRQAALSYMAAVSRMTTPGHADRRGIARLKGGDESHGENGGISSLEPSLTKIREQKAYDPSIAHAKASLPVDRSRILTPDRVIKAVLETPVSSTFCGKVVAMVESDVYGVGGYEPLIPAGSRVIGRCGDFAGGRVSIAWERILTNDGRSVVLSAPSEVRDASGYGGAPGHVYSSPFDRYVLPVFSTIVDVVAGSIMAVYGEDENAVVDANGNVTTSKSAKNEGIRIATEGARDTAKQIISDIRDVRKVVMVPAGTRIDIEINEDIYFHKDKDAVMIGDVPYVIEATEYRQADLQGIAGVAVYPAPENYAGPSVMIDGVKHAVIVMSNGRQGSGGPARAPSASPAGIGAQGGYGAAPAAMSGAEEGYVVRQTQGGNVVRVMPYPEAQAQPYDAGTSSVAPNVSYDAAMER